MILMIVSQKQVEIISPKRQNWFDLLLDRFSWPLNVVPYLAPGTYPLFSLLPGYRGHPTFSTTVSKLRSRILAMPRCQLSHTILTEKNWYASPFFFFGTNLLVLLILLFHSFFSSSEGILKKKKKQQLCLNGRCKMDIWHVSEFYKRSIIGTLNFVVDLTGSTMPLVSGMGWKSPRPCLNTAACSVSSFVGLLLSSQLLRTWFWSTMEATLPETTGCEWEVDVRPAGAYWFPGPDRKQTPAGRSVTWS